MVTGGQSIIRTGESGVRKRGIVRKIEASQQFRFDYPAEFVTLPEYTAHAGQVVTIIKEVHQGMGNEYGDVPLKADGTYEPEPWDVERLFVIQAADGWQGEAWESELEEL